MIFRKVDTKIGGSRITLSLTLQLLQLDFLYFHLIGLANAVLLCSVKDRKILSAIVPVKPICRCPPVP